MPLALRTLVFSRAVRVIEPAGTKRLGEHEDCAGKHAVDARADLAAADGLDARLEAHELPAVTAKDGAGRGARGAALAAAAGAPQ